MPRPRLFAACALLVLTGLLLLACGEAASTGNLGTAVTGTVAVPTPPPHFTIGQEVKIGATWLIRVNRVQTTGGSGYDPAPPAGSTYLLLDVTMQNLSTSQQQANPFDFGLRDLAGDNEQEAVLFSIPVFGGTLTAGEQAHGALAFTVPKNTHAFTLAYIPSTTYPPEILAEWDISD